MKSVTLTLLIVSLVHGFPARAQSVNTARLDSLFASLGTHDRAMCAVAFAKNGRIVYHREIGYEQVDTKTPATAETEYRIGSISKVFTAVMIFQLIEERKLSLTTLLSEYFPQIPNAKKITIKLLLQHRSGIHNFTDDSDFTSWRTTPQTEEKIISVIAGNKPDFEPDSNFGYSNPNFMLLGYIIERITGHSYAEELDRRIIKRLGMAHTYFGGAIGAKPHEAGSYHAGDSTWDKGVETDVSVLKGSGAIVSNTTDLIQFIDALFRGKLVGQTSLDSMKSLIGNKGMGLERSWFFERYSLGHSGKIDGFLSQVSYFPDDSTEWVILGNGWRTDMTDIAIDAKAIYFDLPHYPIPNYKTLYVSTKMLDAYCGTYQSLRMTITIKRDNRTLIADVKGQSEISLDAVDTDRFECRPADIVLTFHRDKEAFDSFKLLQGGHTETFQKQ